MHFKWETQKISNPRYQLCNIRRNQRSNQGLFYQRTDADKFRDHKSLSQMFIFQNRTENARKGQKISKSNKVDFSGWATTWWIQTRHLIRYNLLKDQSLVPLLENLQVQMVQIQEFQQLWSKSVQINWQHEKRALTLGCWKIAEYISIN